MGRNYHYVKIIYFLELRSFCICRTCHASQLIIEEEIILKGNGGQGLIFTFRITSYNVCYTKLLRLINRHNLAQEPRKCKQETGYIPDRPYLFEKLTGYEFLQFIASLYNLAPDIFSRNTEHYLKLFDLEDWEHHLIESYSHGMRQKLIISSIFMLEPPLIVVDEPMVGLDPKSARIVKELFKRHAATGASIFLFV